MNYYLHSNIGTPLLRSIQETCVLYRKLQTTAERKVGFAYVHVYEKGLNNLFFYKETIK